MRLLIVNHIQNAYQSLRANRMRTLLTMLGITIGVASITSILALSDGAAKLVSDQVEELGGNVAVVRPGTGRAALYDLTANSGTPAAASTLTENDVRSIESIPGVEAAAPLLIVSGSVRSQDSTVRDSTVVATTPSLVDISGLEVRDGQFMDSVTNEHAAVIGQQLSVNLYGTDQSIGNTFTVRGQTYTIIGVLKRQNNPVNFNSVDFDNAALISLESAKDFYDNVAHIQQINFRTESVNQLPGIISAASETISNNHQGEEDFRILSGNDISRPSSELFDLISGVAAAIAGISLLVGGIGIMNIMLVNVAERTREIGIRKALGASNTHIIWQFLIESLALSVGGGILGYFLGYLIAFGLSTILPFTASLSWPILGIAVGVSVLVGVLFGLYPAIRAARKDPIESLRHYA